MVWTSALHQGRESDTRADETHRQTALPTGHSDLFRSCLLTGREASGYRWLAVAV
jgi:hypothetical protein